MRTFFFKEFFTFPLGPACQGLAACRQSALAAVLGQERIKRPPTNRDRRLFSNSKVTYLCVTPNLPIMQPQTLDVFQVIADPSRRQMLVMLSKNSMTINSLAENFDMSRPAVSKHVKILYNAGFISIKDIGRERHCVLKQDGFEELQDFISYFDKFWATKLKKLQTLLDNKSKQRLQ